MSQRLNKLSKKYRIDSGMSQTKLAKELGYKSPQFISNFERGDCTLPLKRVKRLRKTLNIPQAALRNVLIADYVDRVAKALK